MSTKKKGMLTVTDEWKKHLKAAHKRQFWKGERRAAKIKLDRQKKDNGG